ncbi:serine hydrolase [Roseococcus sp. YIM B11640]|uniref:serine hydrolase n=1 Tax=Roseococcus sp. YIM B11640 TaxID=3133973 RepID=UPI003C7C2956
MTVTTSRRLALSAPLLGLAAGRALAQGVPVNPVEEGMARFAALSGSTGAEVVVDDPAGAWRVGQDADKPLFVGSVIKTFILAAYLLEVEAGRLEMTEQLPVNDGIRSMVSPVLGEVTGTMPAKMVLEAMIAHSDNTATDIALKRVGVEKVRAVVAAAPLRDVAVVTSTRRLFSWLAGAAPGQDLDWAGMQGVMADRLPGTPRAIAVTGDTMAAPASSMTGWYRHVLSGRVFQRPTALSEFKRISAMADALSFIVPADIAAYGKGGSIVWRGENALSVAGQMVVRGIPASFSFTRNWPGEPEKVPAETLATIEVVRAILAAVARRIG